MNVDRLTATIPNKTEAERRQMRANAERSLVTGTEKQQTAARALIAALDEHDSTRLAVEAERLRGMARAERVTEAFRIVPPTESDVKMIRALLENPGSTSTELSTICDWKGQSWHLHFGMMCERRQSYLWPAEPAGKRDALFYCGIIADYDEATSTWTMKPDVAAAFETIGIRTRRPA